MKTLLLCGYRSRDEHAPALGLNVDADGHTLIDRRIVDLRALGLDPICVVAGSQADAQLRASPRLADAELAYDDQPEVNLLSNLRAGLQLSGTEAVFVLPVEIPAPTKELWQTLSEGATEEHDLVQMTDAQGAPSHFGFPLLVTAKGARAIRYTTELKGLLDTRLNYLHLSVVASATSS